MINKKHIVFLMGILGSVNAMAAADLRIEDRFFKSAITSTVPADKRAAVSSAHASAGDSVSVSEMADICDAGFKESANRLNDAIKFVDAVLGAQAKYQAASAECVKLKGRMSGDVCVGLDGAKLVYGTVCPSGQVCVTDFTNVRTNMQNVHMQYISAYAMANGLQLTCLDTYRDSGIKHYLQCSARGMPYEFEFAALNAFDVVAPVVEDELSGEEEIVVPSGTFCPANGNALKSITDKTKVGDACTSYLIASGTVFMRKNNTCSCRAQTCVSGLAATSGVCCPIGKTYDNNTRKCTVPEPEKQVTPEKEQSQIVLKYFDVCYDDKGKSGGVEHCVQGVFNWVNVQMLQAADLAKEYSKRNFGKDVSCHTTYTEHANDDYVLCTSTDGKDYFAYQFDDVVESTDGGVARGSAMGVCKLFGGSAYKVSPNSCSGIPVDKQDALSQYAQRFALGVNCENTDCTFYDRSGQEYGTSFDNDLKNIGKIDGLDNCVFYIKNSLQIKSDQNIVSQIEAYVRSQKTIDSFTCNLRPTQIDSDKTAAFCGKNNSDGAGLKDDVFRCYVDGAPIDFIFDDMSEFSKTLDKGGRQAMSCVALGGKFTGDDCVLMDEAQCNQIKRLNEQTCPECKLAEWDANDKMCKLPSAASARKLQDGIQVATNVGIGVMVVVATAVSGGSALAIAGSGVALAGTITIETTDIVQDNSMRDFIQQLNACNSTDCARTLLTAENLKAMENTKKTDDNELLVDAMDALLNRLWANADAATINKLADMCGVDSEGYLLETDTCPFYPSKVTGYQIAKAVGTVLEIAGGAMMIAGSFGKVTHTVEQQIENLKTTGWIKVDNGWLNQTTKEVVQHIPRGTVGWVPKANRWMAYGATSSNSTFGFVKNVADVINITEYTTPVVNVVPLIGGTYNVGKGAADADGMLNQPWVPMVQ